MLMKCAIVFLAAAFVAVSAYAPLDIPHPREEVEALKPSRHLLDDRSATQLAFWIAVNGGDLEGIRRAHEDGADAEDKTEPSGYRPIHLAAAIGNLKALMLLLDYGVDVNAQTTNGTTALHYASNHGDVLVTTMLLSRDADPNLKDGRGFAPLHFASYANQYQFKTEASVGSDYYTITKEASTETSVTSEARSKASVAGMGEFLGCVKALIKAGADVNVATGLKETPLHYTPAFDQYEITKVLIDAKANVDAVDEEGETPLHEACAYGAVGVTQLLLLNGADPAAKEENGLTPVEFICRCSTYRNQPTLTQCAPGKCNGIYDTLVLQHAFSVIAGEK